MRLSVFSAAYLFASACAFGKGIDWLEQESKHFRVIYHESHAYLVPHIVSSAESALTKLSNLFSYSPTEKIVINTYDVNDYGSAFTTTVPHNYIWLDVAPMEPGYENIPYNERIRWLISHELVHVVVNDLSSSAEAFCRSVFSKVQPEQQHPLSTMYSLLTNYSRYTPRWHQEGIAVFLETWLNGGYGRVMGNFDEMYFRSMVDEGRSFPSDLELETDVAQTSHLIETVFYLYGGRFASHLAQKYGVEKLVAWYVVTTSYTNFRTSFHSIYEVNFETAWREFVQAERQRQEVNLLRLASAPLAPVRRISRTALGAVTQPHLDPRGGALLFGVHAPHKLASIVRTDWNTGEMEEIATLSAPSLFQVSSTAFDPTTRCFFFTTNNNQLFRDIWMLDMRSGEESLLLKDARIGHLTVSPRTHELWGIRHHAGIARLVRSAAPYATFREVVEFEFGNEILGLSANPSGELLAAVLHKTNGDQSIVIVETEKLRAGTPVTYTQITNEGSPENPSWSADGKTLYWNAYTNGVSNIFRKNMAESEPIAVTHTLRGLFKPIELSADSLFAFEFSTRGFVPVVVPNGKSQRVPAIRYLGQEVQEKSALLVHWNISLPTHVLETAQRDSVGFAGDDRARRYNGLSRIELASFFPAISGFQQQKVVGLFARFSDPVLDHDIAFEAGVSPFGENVQRMRFHLKLKYEYQKEYELNVEHNAPDFFDLFNKRKRGQLGNKFRLAGTHYWVYDNPLKVKQLSEIVLYTNVSSINDNIVRVSQPDFMIAQTVFNSQNLRRSIGSVDFESGNEFNLALMFFGSNPKAPQTSFNLYGEWDNYSIAIAPHNVFHFKLAAGVHQINDKLLQSRFYFGGFGNRALENVSVKQYRKAFSLPGIPVFSLGSDRFAKVMFENNFPPIRFMNASLGEHYVSHLDASVFSQALLTKSQQSWWGVSVGGQVNFVLKHWFNLESTLSAGVARAWLRRQVADEWFVSWKLLKN